MKSVLSPPVNKILSFTPLLKNTPMPFLDALLKGIEIFILLLSLDDGNVIEPT